MHSEKQNPAGNQKSLNPLPISSEEMGKLMQDISFQDTPIRLRATGNSMKPFILDGDVLTITPLLQSKPAIGKVIAFINPRNQNLLIHRIIVIKASSFLSKGDNSYQKTDGWTNLSQILGCVTRIERDEKDVRVGLGVERFLLASLSRHNLLKRITQRISIVG